MNAKPFIATFTNSLDSDHLFFDDTGLRSLDPEEKENCEGPLTKSECLQALKSMHWEKTPGSDGLPADFYKVFWNNLAYCFDQLCLSGEAVRNVDCNGTVSSNGRTV